MQVRMGKNRHLRRAAVVVQVAVASTVVMGMGALAVDMGALYVAQTELQISADAAALAGAAELAGQGDVQSAAIDTADYYASLNKVMGLVPAVYEEDVEFGRAVPATQGDRFEFQPAAEKWDALRVTLRHLQSEEPGQRPGVAIPLSFAQIFGLTERELEAQATAVLVPRDIALVIDLSNSMCWDSQLRFWNRSDGGYSNLRDVWCALDGLEPSRPYVPTHEQWSEYADDTGPTFGEMTEWGDPLVPGSYSASSDPGLWYIPKYNNCTNTTARSRLYARGYCTSEVNALLSGSQDGNYSTNWRNRVGVILGLAEWHSGHNGGMDPSGGNGNTTVGNSETSWHPAPAFAENWGWSSYCTYARSGFKYRFGLKTFVDFLMESRPSRHQTSVLGLTPEEPLRAVKDAVNVMIQEVDDLDSLDHASLQIFGQTARQEVDLTDDLQSVPDRLYQMQSGHYDRYTNIGGGLAEAIETFERPGSLARGSAHKIIMLMSDGKANVDSCGNIVGDGAYAACEYAREQARYAADQGYRIYTVSVGYYVDRNLMDELATIGNGEEFYASGDPATYTEELREIFQTLGGKRPVALID